MVAAVDIWNERRPSEMISLGTASARLGVSNKCTWLDISTVGVQRAFSLNQRLAQPMQTARVVVLGKETRLAIRLL